jgi:hypothetical protein
MVRQVLLDERFSSALQGFARRRPVVLCCAFGTGRGDAFPCLRSRFPGASQVLLFLNAIRVVEVVPRQSLDDSRGRPEPKPHDAEPLFHTSRIM